MGLGPSLQFAKQTNVAIGAVVLEVLFSISTCSDDHWMLLIFLLTVRVKLSHKIRKHIPLYMY